MNNVMLLLNFKGIFCFFTIIINLDFLHICSLRERDNALQNLQGISIFSVKLKVTIFDNAGVFLLFLITVTVFFVKIFLLEAVR